MVHRFFLEVRKNRKYFSPKFRKRFKVFFLNDEEGYNNVSTWLGEVDTFIPSNGFQISTESLQIAQNTFIAHGIDPTKNQSVFHFWVLLTAIDVNLGINGYTRDDNIFGFMKGQRLDDVQVVVIGNDPHETELSSGFAFHNSKCYSTRNLIDSVQYEMNLVSAGEDQSPLLLDDRFYTDAKNNCDLSGWISQNVLLINIILTYSRSDKFVSKAWKEITSFFIKRLNDSKSNLVFMLLGLEVKNTAMYNRWGPLVNSENHLKLELYHPGHGQRTYEHLRWENLIPLINTNLYFYQKEKAKCMVDWMSINSVSTEKENRVIELKKLLDDILAETSGTWRSLGIVDKDGIRKLRKTSQ